MAFMLPLIAGGIGSLSGFVAGYYINQSTVTDNTQNSTQCIRSLDTITELQIIEMKNMTPHKEINYELITFDKSQLKSVVQVKARPTIEQDIMENLRQKIASRRASIQPVL
jgi:hypothetical protein